MPKAGDFDWNAAAVARLTELWHSGMSTALIGERMRMTKNMVIGKARRLDLPARPSPTARADGAPRPRCARKRAGPVTLPPLTALAPPELVVVPQGAVMAELVAPLEQPAPPPWPLPPPKPVMLPAAAPAPYLRVVDCCWPIGEPGASGFRFCEAMSVPGKPYCASHAELAYVKVPVRRAAEAARS